MELDFLPNRHEDEDLRSIIYKYHLLSNKSIKETNKELFGSENTISLFPRNIGKMFLSNNIQISESVENFINKHTFFRIACMFNSDFDNNLMLAYLSNGTGKNLFHSKLLDFISKIIMYCPICLIEDYQNVGECYIHRLHQIKNLNLCLEHRCKLISVCPNCSRPLSHPSGKYQILKPNCTYCQSELFIRLEYDLDDDIVSKKIKFLSAVQYVLSTNQIVSSCMIKVRYLGYAFRDGYFTNAKISNIKLLNDISCKYSDTLLNEFNIKLNLTDEHYTKNFIDFKFNYSNLLQHYLFMDFFGGSILTFLEGDVPEVSSLVPFGVGPWPCKNEICTIDDKNAKIRLCKKRYDRKNRTVIGSFCCPECGMVYNLTFDIKERKIIDSSFKIIARGHLWANHILTLVETRSNSELKSLGIDNNVKRSAKKILRGKQDGKKSRKRQFRDEQWFKQLIFHAEQELNLSQIAKKLGASTTTIKKYLKLYIDGGGQVFSELEVSNEKRENRLSEIKTFIMQLLENNPDLNKSQFIEKIGPSDYGYIKYHDKKWIDETLPLKTDFKDINWIELDEHISAEIESAAQKIYNTNPIRKVMTETILKKVPIKYRRKIERFPFNLPKAISKLRQVIEDDEQYQIRKIPFTVTYLNRQGRRVTLTNILKQNKYQSCSEKVIVEIERFLNNEGYN